MALLLPAFFTVHSGKTRPGLLASPSSPRRLARFVADHAPDGSLLLNTYNAGPWLIWEAGQRIQIAIDPRNNLGAEQLRRHFEQVVLDPAQYRAEVERFGVNLAMLDLYGDQSTPVSRYLGQAAEWRLVFLDGRYALFARTVAKNESLIAAHAYRVLQARLGFEYWPMPWQDTPCWSPKGSRHPGYRRDHPRGRPRARRNCCNTRRRSCHPQLIS